MGAAVLALAVAPRVGAQSRGDGALEADEGIDGREATITRAFTPWTPSGQLPMPPLWSWVEYKSNLEAKDASGASMHVATSALYSALVFPS